MSMLILAAQVPEWVIYTGVGFFVLVSLMMIGIVLIQKPKGGGLSSAFGGGGGGGSSNAMFGSRAGDVATWFTVGVFLVFMLTAILLVYATKPASSEEPNQPTTVTPVESEEEPEETVTEPETESAPETEADPANTPAETPATQPATTQPATP